MTTKLAAVLMLSAIAVAGSGGAQIGRVPFAAPPATPAVSAAPAPLPSGKVARPSNALAARTLAKNASRFDPIFQKYSKRYFGPGFDWQYFKVQSIAESGLDPEALSHVGARGLMQLMPSTFKEIQSVRPELVTIDDPESNIAAGIMHDRYLWRYWGDKKISEEQRAAFMFGSYNAGEGTIGRATQVAATQKLDNTVWGNIEQIAPTVPRWRYTETVGYVRKIGNLYEIFKKPPQ